jgi:hypothetical protein
MNTFNFVITVLSSFGISLTGVWWFSQQLITQRLTRQKDLWQAEIRKEVEVYLGEKSSEREYNLQAKKRLYTAIGPLRFQLLLACRDVATRIYNYSLDHRSFGFRMDGYYGQSTLYRLLRPVAITELIERQIAYADFSVDPSGIDLLKFRKAAFMSFTDSDILIKHPMADWSRQKEHLFSGTLSTLANKILVSDANVMIKDRPMHFHEFQAQAQEEAWMKQLAPLTEILQDFRISRKPIFWLRLVCFGHSCNEYIGQSGGSVGIAKLPYDITSMLSRSEDGYILSHLDAYKEAFDMAAHTSL